MVLNQDFREFIALLNANNVRYLIVGGYAVTFHGYPRYTNDIDIWIMPEESNATRIIKVLNEFGFGSLDIQRNDLLSLDNVIQLGYPPNRIDLLTHISGVEFEHCYKNRVKLNIEGLIIDFIDLESLKINKKASGRYKDLNDVENLEL